jgi:hypothetical protein
VCLRDCPQRASNESSRDYLPKECSFDFTNHGGLRIFSSADEDLYDNISKSEYDIFIQPNANLNKSTMNLVNSTLGFEKIDINKNGLLTVDEVDEDTANYLRNKLNDFKITLVNSSIVPLQT